MELKVIVPTSLSEITLEQYQRFARLEGDEEFLTKKMLEIFCNVPFDKLPNVRFKDVSSVFKHINVMMNDKPSLTQRFTLNGQEFGFIPSLEDITYGEFVDLDSYLTDTKNLHKTMAVLYRPVIQKAGKRYDIEPYESATKYCDLMKDAPMDVVIGAILFFLDFRKRTLDGYSDLFGGGSGEDEYSSQSQFGKRWGWYTTFYSLAQGDVRRFDAVGRLPLYQCLTFLSFEKHKQETENKILKSKLK